jgi:formylglycine-generating enzyme required for sulfatase activity
MKTPSVFSIMGVAAVCLGAAGSAGAGTLKCPPDSVKVGTACIDLYEASVWRIPGCSPRNFRAGCQSLLDKVQQGTVTLADLTMGGATQLGPDQYCQGPEDYGANFPQSGNWRPEPGSNPPTPGVYAVSIPGVQPAGCISWFQANQACRLSGKRLVRNDEWQAAAQGTPDPGTDNGSTDCAIRSQPSNTGSRSNCKSVWGVFDMVGNVSEWVADWADNNGSSPCTGWTTVAGIPPGDNSCFGGSGGVGSSALPAALFRGGYWFSGVGAGVFNVGAFLDPSSSIVEVGFRCAR